jgi:thioredoxin 1
MKKITEIEFRKILEGGLKNYTIIDFFSENCNPCMKMMPIVEEVETIFTDIDFYKIDVDEFSEIAEEYGVVGLPTLVFMIPGQKNINLAGLRSKDKLISNIQKIFNIG